MGTNFNRQFAMINISCLSSWLCVENTSLPIPPSPNRKWFSNFAPIEQPLKTTFPPILILKLFAPIKCHFQLCVASSWELKYWHCNIINFHVFCGVACVCVWGGKLIFHSLPSQRNTFPFFTAIICHPGNLPFRLCGCECDCECIYDTQRQRTRSFSIYYFPSSPWFKPIRTVVRKTSFLKFNMPSFHAVGGGGSVRCVSLAGSTGSSQPASNKVGEFSLECSRFCSEV